jgi:NAD(P)-dependent dehydrogenase (short-subunit alcohol dehydrogenase family)
VAWNAEDLPDLTGTSAVVTGANSGIGYVTARELARHGAHVVLACRSQERANAAVDRLLDEVPDADVAVHLLDLADLASVREFADTLPLDRLDRLVNNAGVMALPRRTTADGFEMQLGTNHLGHFALTGLLLDRLLSAPAPRVTTVSSLAHRAGWMRWDDLQGEHRYFRWAAYGQAKLANLLFALELQRRADAAGVALTSTAAHPGYTATNLQTASAKMTGNAVEERANELLNRVVAQDAETGALPTLFAAAGPVPGGIVAGPGGFLEMHGSPRVVGVSGRAQDPGAAARLWQVSETLTGVTFGWG